MPPWENKNQINTSKTLDNLGRRRARRHTTVGHRTIATTRRIATRSTAHPRVCISHTAVLVNRRRGRDLFVSSRVNSNADPRHDSVGDVFAELHPLDERIHVGRFFAQDRVVGVEGQVLGVGVVGSGCFDEGDEGLVEEDLSDVGGVSCCCVDAEKGGVCADGGGVGVVGEDVDVGCAWGDVLVFGGWGGKTRGSYGPCSVLERSIRTERRRWSRSAQFRAGK